MTRARDLSNLIGYKTSDNQETLTATAGQTSFAVTNGYTAGFVNVWMNGLLLDPGVDYTATDGTNIVLTDAAQAGDELEVLKYEVYGAGDVLPVSGGTMTGDLAVSTNYVRAGQHSSDITNLASNLDFAQFGSSTIIQTGADAQGFIKSNHYWNGSGTSYINTAHGSTTVRLNENNEGIFQIETATSGGVGTTPRLKIDSEGRVTKPTQPLFRVGQSGSINYGSDAKVAWDQEDVDIGGHFDIANDRFTAPVSGWYHMGLQVTINGMSSPGNYIAFYFKINGAGTGFRYRTYPYNNTNIWTGVNGSMAIDLTAGDYIELWAYAHTGYLTTQGNEHHWYGYLLQ